MTMMEVATLVVGLSLIASIGVQAVHSDIAFGMRYSASARDDERSDVMSRRLARVVRNQVEGVAMFAPLAILAGTGAGAGVLGWASLVYATSRVLHCALHAVGVQAPRSAIWLVGFGALLIAYADAVLTLT